MKTLAGLDYVEQITAPSGPTVVMFHGYGADCHDLAPLAKVFPPHSAARWIFPNGPLSVPIGPHMSGRAWFPIDMAAVEAAMMRGTHRSFSASTPAGFLEAATTASNFLNALGVKPNDLIIGGFSQGAMLATELALSLPTPPAALIALSGALLSQDRWQQALSNRAKALKVFQSHGRSDAILSFRDAETLQSMFKQNGASTTWQAFDGGHEIPQNVLAALATFIASIHR